VDILKTLRSIDRENKCPVTHYVNKDVENQILRTLSIVAFILLILSLRLSLHSIVRPP